MARNIGDARLWEKFKGTPDRRNFTTAKGMTNQVMPGDIEPPPDKEGQDFDYYWWYMKYEEEFDDLMDRKWALAKTSDGWKNNRWRVDANNFIVWKGHALMYRPADIRREEEAEAAKLDMLKSNMQMVETELHEMADKAGVGTYRIEAGRTENVIKPRKR